MSAIDDLRAKIKAVESVSAWTVDLHLATAKAILAEIETLQTRADAATRAAEEQAKREYHTGRCEDCGCCTVAQCAEHRCPENAVGESICPCTCD